MDALDLLSDVIRKERTSLVRVARKEGLSPEDAVDCVHDACCTFLRLAQRGQLPDDHAAYLATIVRNEARNERRLHRLARPHVEVDLVGDALAADDALARAETHMRLHACVNRLCDTQKAVVTLRMLEERDGEDVASALGITRGYVDVLLHRAKASLLRCMME